MTDRIAPVAPVAHSFEWDARRKRIVGIRFRMDDGSERVVGARVEEVETSETERLVDVRV